MTNLQVVTSKNAFIDEQHSKNETGSDGKDGDFTWDDATWILTYLFAYCHLLEKYLD